jgi:hypothetical protein
MAEGKKKGAALPKAEVEAPPKTADKKKGFTGPKTECPVTRAQFQEKVKKLDLSEFFDGAKADPKQFASGSFGWYYGTKSEDNEKIKTMLGINPDDTIKIQVGVNLIIVGSKELPAETEE